MRATDRRGFILATTLLVMTVLTVMLAAAFVMVSAEFRTTNGSFGATRALNLAQSGLESYLAAPHTYSSWYDSTSYTFTGGYARVVARRLRDSTASSQALWVVYATGVDTTNRTNAGSSGGQRVVAVLAKLTPGYLPARAAMVAANGVTMVGGGGNPITGRDYGAITGNCPTTSRHDTVGLSTDAYGGSTGAGPTNGTELLASDMTVVDSTYIDWAKLIAGQFTPDYVNQLPPIGNSNWSIYYFPDSLGTVTIPSAGGAWRRGLLVTQGDVVLADRARWDGVILAGGSISGANNAASYVVHGMVVTGLNVSRGKHPISNQLQRGPAWNSGTQNGRTIQWDFCYATSSIASLGYLTRVNGAATDSWKTW